MSPAEASPEIGLVRQAREGDDTAVAELYRRHRPAMLAYARGCCRDEHTAEDLVSEAFARTLQAVRGGGGPTGAWRPYLYTVTRNVAMDWARTDRRGALAESFDAWADVTSAGPEERVADSEDHTMIVRAFRSLPERWQTVLWHSVVEGEPRSQVATAMGTSPGNVGVMVFRAREELRQAYLAAHATATGPELDCERYSAPLAAAVRRRGGRRPKALREHMERCVRCRMAYAELTDLNGRLRTMLPGALALGAIGKAPAAGLLQRITDLPVAVTGAAGAAAVTAVAIPVVITLSGPEPPSRAPALPPAVVMPPPASSASAAPSRKPTPTTTRTTTRPSSSPSPSSSPKPSAKAQGASSDRGRAIASGQEMITIANQERARQGRGPLRTDPRLNQAAAQEAVELARRDNGLTPSSDTNTTVKKYGYPMMSAVFRYYGIGPQGAVRNWSSSGMAQADSSRAIGAACANGPSGGRIYCSVIIGNY
ncbi:sigma-70 family RNA polymerase sigma factor [Spirillospora sp. CA-294931]|uniref:sigma-70 family RNA polymerase sigma factor n=1 Tax=Spirillospora sp. CA-294931 TaxID=3240042 RepID=UPI003D8B3170